MKNIIVVDMQKAFMNETNKHLIDRINHYLKSNEFDNIFFTRCVNDCESPFTKILGWKGATSIEEQEIVLNVPSDAKIITKNCYGISVDDINMMKKLGITEIEICGVDTDACCLAIAFNLFDKHIKPIILSDLCASTSKNPYMNSNALELMKRQFGSDNVR